MTPPSVDVHRSYEIRERLASPAEGVLDKALVSRLRCSSRFGSARCSRFGLTALAALHHPMTVTLTLRMLRLSANGAG
jgi:hypothetical protein